MSNPLFGDFFREVDKWPTSTKYKADVLGTIYQYSVKNDTGNDYGHKVNGRDVSRDLFQIATAGARCLHEDYVKEINSKRKDPRDKVNLTRYGGNWKVCDIVDDCGDVIAIIGTNCNGIGFAYCQNLTKISELAISGHAINGSYVTSSRFEAVTQAVLTPNI
jgi:hypothetical protein